MKAKPLDGVEAHPGYIVVYVTDELAAYDLALAFGRDDGFRREVEQAALIAWPDDVTAQIGPQP